VTGQYHPWIRDIKHLDDHVRYMLPLHCTLGKQMVARYRGSRRVRQMSRWDHYGIPGASCWLVGHQEKGVRSGPACGALRRMCWDGNLLKRFHEVWPAPALLGPCAANRSNGVHPVRMTGRPGRPRIEKASKANCTALSVGRLCPVAIPLLNPLCAERPSALLLPWLCSLPHLLTRVSFALPCQSACPPARRCLSPPR
jgi:hypothetical protein